MKTDNHIISRLYYEARRRSKEFGLEFNITKDDIILPAVCPILGIPLQSHDKTFGRNSYSLDRIDPRKGYVKGNIRVISWQANRFKENFTEDQIERMLKYVRGEL
jgi:hypothetical protein